MVSVEPLSQAQLPVARRVVGHDDLLRSAYRLMASKGMHRMTLQDVADEVGMSKANLVYHYKTKEDLVLTAMQWVLEQVAARIAEATASAVGREAKIRAMIDAIFFDPQRNRTFYIVYAELIAHASRNGRYAALNEWFREAVNGQYALVINDAGGAPSKAVLEAAMVIRAVIDGLFLQWLEETDWEGCHRRYKELCVSSIVSLLERRA